MKRSFMQNNKAATEKGVKIVHCCGYDRCGGKADQADRPLTIHAPALLPHSIPSDLGTHMMVEYIKKNLGKKTAKVCVSVAVQSEWEYKKPFISSLSTLYSMDLSVPPTAICTARCTLWLVTLEAGSAEGLLPAVSRWPRGRRFRSSRPCPRTRITWPGRPQGAAESALPSPLRWPRHSLSQMGIGQRHS